MKKRKPDDNIVDGAKAAGRMSVNRSKLKMRKEIQKGNLFVLFFLVISPSSLGGMRSLDHVGSFYPQRENQLFIAAASG